MGWHGRRRAVARLPKVTKCVRWSKDDVPLGICILELSRCSSLSRRIVYLEQLHRLAGTINLTGVPRIPLLLTLPLTRAQGDSAATLWVTSAIPAQSGGERVSPRSSQYSTRGCRCVGISFSQDRVSMCAYSRSAARPPAR